MHLDFWSCSWGIMWCWDQSSKPVLHWQQKDLGIKGKTLDDFLSPIDLVICSYTRRLAMAHFSYFQTKDIQLKEFSFIGGPILYMVFAFCRYIIVLFAEQFQESITSHWFSVGTVLLVAQVLCMLLNPKLLNFSCVIYCQWYLDLTIKNTNSSSIKVQESIFKFVIWSYYIQEGDWSQ